jgi:multicomponent Na+:H+ antiporter subunit D
VRLPAGGTATRKIVLVLERRDRWIVIGVLVALSANLFTLFVSYQALILAGAPLIQDRTPEEEGRAARVYLTTQLGASIGLFLPAVVWTYSLAGAAEFQVGGVLAGLIEPISPAVASVLLVLFVLGASMSIVPPLSAWINASSGSRWPALISIHSLALAPAGVISIIKIAAYIFGSALVQASLASHALLVLCGAGAALIRSVAHGWYVPGTHLRVPDERA